MEYIEKRDEVLGNLKFWRHHQLPVAGINNQTFVDFTHFTNDWDFKKIDDEICIGLSLTDTTNIPMVSGEMPPEILEQYNGRVFEGEYFWNLEEEEDKRIIKDMTINQRRKYLLFKNKIILPWYFISVLKPNKFATKSEDLYPWEDFVDLYMPYTKNCLLKLPFKQIGRVVIYSSLPNIEVPCHRDDVFDSHRDHHINLNPGGYRPVYVYDSIRKNKIYLNQSYKAYAYNVRDYHGVDGTNQFSYTIRVDGEYNDEVCNQLNLVDGLIK